LLRKRRTVVGQKSQHEIPLEIQLDTRINPWAVACRCRLTPSLETGVEIEERVMEQALPGSSAVASE